MNITVAPPLHTFSRPYRTYIGATLYTKSKRGQRLSMPAAGPYGHEQQQGCCAYRMDTRDTCKYIHKIKLHNKQHHRPSQSIEFIHYKNVVYRFCYYPETVKSYSCLQGKLQKRKLVELFQPTHGQWITWQNYRRKCWITNDKLCVLFLYWKCNSKISICIYTTMGIHHDYRSNSSRLSVIYSSAIVSIFIFLFQKWFIIECELCFPLF